MLVKTTESPQCWPQGLAVISYDRCWGDISHKKGQIVSDLSSLIPRSQNGPTFCKILQEMMLNIAWVTSPAQDV